MRRCLFFAQDIFGLQFCLHEDRVALFDPETAAVEPFAASIEEWAQRLLVDHDVLCGSSLAEQWEASGEAIPPGTRLIPKIPLVAGGSFELSNLYAGEIVAAMRFRASIAKQIRDLPDGAKIRLVIGS